MSCLSTSRRGACLLAGLALFALAPEVLPLPRAPELASTVAPAARTHSAAQHLAVTANPKASQAALKMLERGGSAADAAIAAQLVLGLVEPQSSGLGGGGFAMYWDAKSTELSALDGRETAPLELDWDHFLDKHGKPLSFFKAWVGGLAVGAPGMPALLWELHRRHGRLSWAELHQPAIELAERGFKVSPRLAALIAGVYRRIEPHPSVRDYFFTVSEQGARQPLAAGALLRNPAYAKTLRRLARNGPHIFYRGQLGRAVVDAVRGDPIRPGLLRMSDLGAYRVIERAPLCAAWRGKRLCGMPLPSSGAAVTLAILRMFDLAVPSDLSMHSPQFAHFFVETSKRAYADRDAWMADPAYAPPDILSALIAPEYLARRADSIAPWRAQGLASPGEPLAGKDLRLGGQSAEQPSTTHLAIVDAWGNALSMTTSIEAAFGAHIFVAGFLLNNQLTDFAFAARDQKGHLVANSPGPGKRPLSSMTPMIVFAKDRPHLLIGSPGGLRIPSYVARMLLLRERYGVPLAEAAASGHIVHTNRSAALELERGRFAARVVDTLRAMGHEVRENRHTSGLHMIERQLDGSWLGIADPRREGLPLGH